MAWKLLVVDVAIQKYKYLNVNDDLESDEYRLISVYNLSTIPFSVEEERRHLLVSNYNQDVSASTLTFHRSTVRQHNSTGTSQLARQDHSDEIFFPRVASFLQWFATSLSCLSTDRLAQVPYQ